MKPKLRRAFARLADDGIKAKMNHSISISNGIAEMQRSGHHGYCFYHSQDSERARKEGEVWLAFGVFARQPKDPDIVKVGRLVKKALLREGLHVVWNGSAGSRIEVHLSKAAYVKKQKDDRAEWKAKDKKIAGIKKKVDVPALDAKLLAAVNALPDELLPVSYGDFWDHEKKWLMRAQKARRHLAQMPLGSPLPDGNGEITIFIRGGESHGFRGMLAVRLKHELHRQGLKARVQSGMVFVDLS
jgi:hypothetical protein